jgi:hypothetical protein
MELLKLVAMGPLRSACRPNCPAGSSSAWRWPGP